MRRILRIAALAVLLGCAVGAYLGYKFLRSGLPMVDGFVEVEGLQKPVQVFRNVYGVPTIWAEREDDLYFATGFVMAQDRLFQMDLMRRAAAGRLSEILGEAGLEQDEESRIIGFARDAKRLAAMMGQDTRRILEAFGKGVNAYIESTPSLSVEFRALGYEPEPWEPWHTIAIARLVGWTLGMRIGLEVISMYARARLGDALAERLVPARLGSDAMRLDSTEQSGEPRPVMKMPPMPDDLRAALKEAPPPPRLEAAIAAMGSNSWAVSSRMSESGNPILANDPHLALMQPSFWYILHQHAPPDLNVVGGAVPVGQDCAVWARGHATGGAAARRGDPRGSFPDF